MTERVMTASEIKFSIQEWEPPAALKEHFERQRERVREIIREADARMERVILNMIVRDLCGPMGRWPQ